MSEAAKPSIVTRILSGFRRTTSQGQFIPEIDGLRFIAICSVALWHIKDYLLKTDHLVYHNPAPEFRHLLEALTNGWRGVELFFVISGFILALPFATWRLKNGRSVSLRHYFMRRVTRLEPPYMLAMLIGFFLIWRRRHEIVGYSEYVASFVASLFYSHNFFWPRSVTPLVNPVTWSLEIEIQFYILAPLIAWAYTAGTVKRRVLLLLPIAIKTFLPTSWQLPHVSLLDFYDYFLVGFLLADLYVNRELEVGAHQWLATAGAIFALLGIYVIPFNLLALVIGLFFFCSFKSSTIRKIIGNRWLATVGGMCYSIYLIHWMLITTLGGRFMRHFSGNFAADFLCQAFILVLLVLFAGAVFYKLIERPCMSRDWHIKLASRIRQIFRPQAIAIDRKRDERQDKETALDG